MGHDVTCRMCAYGLRWTSPNQISSFDWLFRLARLGEMPSGLFALRGDARLPLKLNKYLCGKMHAMIRSERRTCTAKAIAEYLALIADVHYEFAPHLLDPVREADKELWQCATEFGAAIERFCAERAISMSASNRRAAERAMRSKIRVTPSETLELWASR
jgi:hypothetical protein